MAEKSSIEWTSTFNPDGTVTPGSTWNPVTGCEEVSPRCEQGRLAVTPRKLVGEENPNWKGGRVLASNGYILVRMPGHPLADVRGYVYEHRLVAEEMLGRPLQAFEQVHHKDEDKQNNAPSNLQVVQDGRHHMALHRKSDHPLQGPDELNREVTCTCGCGTTFLLYDLSGRPRSYVSGHNGRQHLDNPIVECACGCGAQFSKYGAQGKLRTFAPSHNKRCKPREANGLIACACGCGTQFYQYDSSGRSRRFVSGHNGRKCQDVG